MYGTDASRYLSRFATKTRAAFSLKIDSWQADLILKELECCQPSYGATKATLLDLPQQYLQLLFNEPALQNNAKIASQMGEVISDVKEGGSATVSGLGLTPLLVNLLGSSDVQRRKWARSQVEDVRRPLSFDDWTSGGVGTEVQGLLFGDLDVRDRWSAVNLLLKSNRLSTDTVQRGLLEGRYDLSPARADRSVMVPIARLLGSSSDSKWQSWLFRLTAAFPLIFDAFTRLLQISPTKHVWTFDSTPELPHTLFSDIKKNPAFRDVVLAAHPVPSAYDSKSKIKDAALETPSALAWITDYLLSVNDLQSKEGSSGFSEALARVMSFCFSEAQNEPFEAHARAAAAQAGCKVIRTWYNRLTSDIDLITKCHRLRQARVARARLNH